MVKKGILVLGICISMIFTILFVPNISADSTATITIKIHRIQKLDEIEENISDEADWYYYIGISEDGGKSYDWTSPENIPMKENVDDWMVNRNHIFTGITSLSINFAIILCEEDGSPGSDDIADICAGAYGGSNFFWDDLDDPINPESLPDTLKKTIFNNNIYKGSYNLKTDELNGDSTTVEDGYYKTSGEFDGISIDQNDAALYFDIWDDYNTPIAAIGISNNYVKAGELVNFDGGLSSASTGFEIERFQWDFNNDGKWDAEGKTANFTYNKADSYTVKLKITDSLGQTDTDTGFVVVYRDIDASFSYTPLNPAALDTITFTDTSKIVGGKLISWSWNFGDCTTSTLQNPTHKYTHGGLYPVKLKITADDWETTDFEIKYIYVIEYAKITGTVKDTNGDPVSDAIIKLYDNGTVLKTVTTEANGEYIIPDIEIGTYDVEGLKNNYDNYKKTGETLEVGENTVNFVLLLKSQAPHAEFKYSPKKPTTGSMISFTDISNYSYGTIESYSWDFGDGKSSNEQNPKHKFSSVGKYSVNLTITDDRGNNKSYVSVLNIAEPSPGFELIFVLLSIVIVSIILSKKKNNGSNKIS
ncbi:hypothetical protein AYK24_02505 [Thermoplasmatales archaeon SG8-52-4]|nr:MAG: hypothetical protein AYK24_02505 [Thermoplasmatales archaeon SG8-52-4]